VGAFDGRTFTPETEAIALNHGDSYYAAQVFTDLPHGRRVLVPWARQDLPGMPFNQKMGFPVDLTLHETDAGPRLFVSPTREIGALVAKTRQVSGPLEAGAGTTLSDHGELLDMDLDLQPGDASKIFWTIRGVEVSYDAADGRLTCGGSSATIRPAHGILRLRALVDRTSVELFGNGGEVYMPTASIPRREDERVELRCERSPAVLVSATVRELKSAW
jgi:sucrose-6-phosphate hydrolase SacC (GH32 family)